MRDMEREHLFMFGYEDPAERESNDTHGTDNESTGAVRIIAADEKQALSWGREIAERFVKTLHQDPTLSWKQLGFAAWIEEHPDDHLRQRRSDIPVVRVGEHPTNLLPVRGK
jgi:hypothetical protein